MAPSVTTSPVAYDFAKKLCAEYDKRKTKERNLNIQREKKKAADDDAAKKKEGVSRQVTEIDYGKHEGTVKELDRQEKAEEYERKKQEASQWCTLDHEHGPHCKRPVGGCSHDHQKEWQIYEKSTEEKIKAADRFREEGNEAYKKHNYGLASVHYRKALLQFDYTFAEGDEEEKLVDTVKSACLLNLAACKCQLEDWDEVLTQCRLALEINPRSVKAFYRTGLAHLAYDQFDLAKDALMSAYEIEPKNPDVLACLRKLKANISNYKVRQKDVYKEMVNGSATKDSGEQGTQAPPAPSPVAAPTAAAEGGTGTHSDSGAAVASPPAAVADADADAHHDADAHARSAAVSPKTAEAAVPPEDGVSGLRRRHGGTAAPSVAHKDDQRAADDAADAQEEEEEDDAEEKLLGLSHGRAMNVILLVALCLGAVSLVVVLTSAGS